MSLSRILRTTRLVKMATTLIVAVFVSPPMVAIAEDL